jgi:hypothetical protein
MAFKYAVSIEDNGSATLEKISDEAKKLSGVFAYLDNEAKKFTKSIADSISPSTLATKAFFEAANTLAAWGKEMLSNYESAAKLSKNIGVAADSVIGLRHAAELANVGSDNMDKNMVKLSKTIAEAASGSKQASDAFGKMEISVKNFVPTPQEKYILLSRGNLYDFVLHRIFSFYRSHFSYLGRANKASPHFASIRTCPGFYFRFKGRHGSAYSHGNSSRLRTFLLLFIQNRLGANVWHCQVIRKEKGRRDGKRNAGKGLGRENHNTCEVSFHGLKDSRGHYVPCL